MEGNREPPDVDMIATSEKNSVEGRGYGPRSEKAKEEDVERYTPAEEEKKMDEAPDGGKGWIMIACVATINAYVSFVIVLLQLPPSAMKLTISIDIPGVSIPHTQYSLPTVRIPSNTPSEELHSRSTTDLSNNIFPGATPLHYAFIGGLSFSAALLVSPLATMTTRLYGTRTTLLIGVFFETISFIGASFVTHIWHLFLSQGVCFGLGMGFLFVASVPIAPQWFTTKRSLANGISAAGSGLGGLTYSLAAQAMIRNMSLAWAFRILGIIACVVNFSCSIVVKDRNKQIGSSLVSFDYRLFRKMEFWGLLAFGSLSMLGYIVLLFSLPSYARSVGMTASQGSVIGAVLNLGQAMGRPPIGYFSDTVGRLNMAASMTFLAGLFSLVIWMFAKSFGVLIFFALIGGSVAGTFWAIVGPVWTEIMGLVDLPSSLSITWLVLVVPTTCKLFDSPLAC